MSTAETKIDAVQLHSLVSDRVYHKDAEARKAEVRKNTRETLDTDLHSRDINEVMAILKKCTVETFTRDGRKLLLNPYHVYKLLYTERYAGLIDRDSERLPEQQFTAIFISAMRTAIAKKVGAVTAREKSAWLEVLGEQLDIGTKQVTLDKSPVPTDSTFFRFLSERFGL